MRRVMGYWSGEVKGKAPSTWVGATRRVQKDGRTPGRSLKCANADRDDGWVNSTAVCSCNNGGAGVFLKSS